MSKATGFCCGRYGLDFLMSRMIDGVYVALKRTVPTEFCGAIFFVMGGYGSLLGGCCGGADGG